MGQCLAGIGKGLYDSTIGMAINVGKGAIKLVKATAWAITHPKQAWSKTRKRWSEFKSLMKAATSYAAYDTGFGRKDDKFSGYYLGLEDVGYDVQGENGKGDKKSKSSKKTGKGPTYKEDKKNQPKKSSAYSLLTPTQKTKFVCRLVAMFGVAGASWYFMAGNVPALASEVQSFLSGSATVASSESGRKFFMEGEFAKYQESLGEKHKQLKADQIEFSRQWARKNPKEAAAILARYHK